VFGGKEQISKNTIIRQSYAPIQEPDTTIQKMSHPKFLQIVF